MGKFSLLLLIIGLAIEILSSHNVDFIKDTEVARMGLATAEAQKKAADAQLELEQLKALRIANLRNGGFERLVLKVTPFSGLRFDAAITVGDPDCDVLLLVLLDALKKAGLVHVPWQDKNPNGLLFVKEGMPNVGTVSASNVILEVTSQFHPAWGGAQAIAAALRDEGIAAAAFPEVKTNAKNDEVVHLLIGAKR